MSRKLYLPALLILCLLTSACAMSGTRSSGGSQPKSAGKPFKLSNLAKSDVSYMADTAILQMEAMLRELMIKLYKRNPRELQKGSEKSLEVRLESIFSHHNPLIFEELHHMQEIRAMLLGLSDKYEGDRVFAIMVGLTGMVRRSYGYQDEFFMLDSLDGQALYNAARNIEVLAWRLRSRKNTHGEPLLLTNSRPGEIENLSFERQFGKMIALQDFVAEIAASKNNRTISKVVQSVGSMVFLPVP